MNAIQSLLRNRLIGHLYLVLSLASTGGSFGLLSHSFAQDRADTQTQATSTFSKPSSQSRKLTNRSGRAQKQSPSASGSEGQGETPRTRPSVTSNRLSQGLSDQFLGKVVDEVHVDGLKRIEKDAVIAKIGTKPGSIVSTEQVRSDILALFNMGFFDDISVEAHWGADRKVEITYVLKERPVVSKIEFDGNEKLSASDLKDVIKVKEWSILDINKVREDVALIQKHYEDKGFYLAKVSFDLKSSKPDEAELTYKVHDFDKVQIKKITFLNNTKFRETELKGVLGDTREGNFLSFISSAGNFKEAAFKQDLQRLTYWYLEHGYVKFKHENPIITVSDDKKWLYISIYVEEGEQYKIGNVDFGGDLLFPKEELSEGLSLSNSDTFSISKRNADIQHLTEKYQDLGYAFVNVVPKMNIHDDSKTLDIEYDFEKGNLVYFGEINVLGNTKTYDKVIRRELKIHEGQLYSGSKLRISRENAERLGYFSPGEVLFNTVSPPGRSDLLNVEITVKERSTGTITLGAGYGSYQGFFFTSQISEINLFGRGQTISLAGQYSIQRLSQSLNIGFTEPYTFDTLWTTGFDIYAVKFPIPYRWVTSKLGFDIRFGHPVMDYTYGYITYKHEGIQDLQPEAGVPLSTIQADTGILSSIIVSMIRDKRNNRFETSGGNYQSVSFETAGIGGDKKYFKFVANNRYYKRLIGDLVFRNSTEVGQITGYGDEPIPPSQKFYLGGPNNMKGYQLFLLGPQMANSQFQNFPLGGNVEMFSLFELEYPLIKEAGIKGVLFFDAGNTWEHLPQSGEPFTIRTDAGFGFRWFSPIGPLRFEWGFPLSQQGTEQSPVFQFFIGPPF